MAWATRHIEKLSLGENVDFRPHGNSMIPIIKSGEHVFLEPIFEDTILAVKDVVLCKVNGKQYLHLITAIKGDRYQISNNKGHINGWTSKKSIFGRLINVTK